MCVAGLCFGFIVLAFTASESSEGVNFDIITVSDSEEEEGNIDADEESLPFLPYIESPGTSSTPPTPVNTVNSSSVPPSK